MSSTASNAAQATSTTSVDQTVGVDDLKSQQGISLVAFITALATSLVIFGIQLGLFLLLRNKLARIL